MAKKGRDTEVWEGDRQEGSAQIEKVNYSYTQVGKQSGEGKDDGRGERWGGQGDDGGVVEKERRSFWRNVRLMRCVKEYAFVSAADIRCADWRPRSYKMCYSNRLSPLEMCCM